MIPIQESLDRTVAYRVLKTANKNFLPAEVQQELQYSRNKDVSIIHTLNQFLSNLNSFLTLSSKKLYKKENDMILNNSQKNFYNKQHTILQVATATHSFGLPWKLENKIEENSKLDQVPSSKVEGSSFQSYPHSALKADYQICGEILFFVEF